LDQETGGVMDTKHLSSGHSPNVNRYTPSDIFEGLGTKFDLDPCAPREDCPSKHWCANHITLPDDGLELPWSGKVWLNPPFSRGIVGQWTSKLKRHDNGIALVTTYFTSAWFQENAPDGLFLLAKRPRFEGIVAKDKSTIEGRYPSMLMSYGEECTEILQRAKLEGKFYVR
jgi:hypothetical protein